MDKINPYKKIALQFQMSDESAKYFLGRVQKSFKKERPPHRIIVDFIEAQKMDVLLTPYEVAAMLNENGIWPYALNSPPPVMEDEDDRYF